MIHAQNPHIRAAAGAALLDSLRRHVKHPHKADRAARHAAGGVDRAAAGAQTGEGKAGAAAGLMDQRCLLDRLKNRLHTVLDRQNKAGGQLAERPAGVHQRGGIGQEFEIGHHVIELVFQRFHVGLRVVLRIRCGDGFCHTMKQVLDRFNRLAVGVPHQIAALQYRAGILTDLHVLSTLSSKHPYIENLLYTIQYIVYVYSAAVKSKNEKKEEKAIFSKCRCISV